PVGPPARAAAAPPRPPSADRPRSADRRPEAAEGAAPGSGVESHGVAAEGGAATRLALPQTPKRAPASASRRGRVLEAEERGGPDGLRQLLRRAQASPQDAARLVDLADAIARAAGGLRDAE